MAIFSELRDTLEGLESRIGDVDIDVLLTAIRGLDDDAVIGALEGAAAMVNCAERMLTVGAGVVAERSRREAGHSGLAAAHGHRNAVSLVQSIVSGTRTDAARAVRLGESLIEGADAADAAVAGGWSRDDAGDGLTGDAGEDWIGWGDVPGLDGGSGPVDGTGWRSGRPGAGENDAGSAMTGAVSGDTSANADADEPSDSRGVRMPWRAPATGTVRQQNHARAA